MKRGEFLVPSIFAKSCFFTDPRLGVWYCFFHHSRSLGDVLCHLWLIIYSPLNGAIGLRNVLRHVAIVGRLHPGCVFCRAISVGCIVSSLLGRKMFISGHSNLQWILGKRPGLSLWQVRDLKVSVSCYVRFYYRGRGEGQ
jgi:hypothetical protein